MEIDLIFFKQMTLSVKFYPILLFCLMAFSQKTFAQATLSVQGTLQKSFGGAIDDGQYSMTFKLYTTASGGTAVWSDQCYRLMGWDSSGRRATLDAFKAAVHPDDRAAVEVVMRRAVEQGVPADIEHRVVWPNGEVRVLHQLGEPERRTWESKCK